MSAALDSEPVTSKIAEEEDDLFGDDSDEEVVADEDDEDAIKNTKRRHRDIDADDDEDDLGLGDSDDEEAEAAVEDESSLQKAELSLARHPKSHQPDGDVLSFNLPRYLFVDPEPFGPETFENSLNEFMDESKKNGKTTTRELQDSLNFKKLQIRNTIRWRYAKTEDDELYKQSNTRIIEWEDGSLSLKIGDEIFDIRSKTNEDNLLAFLGGQVLISTLNLNKSIQITPTSTNSFAHKILARSLASDQAIKKAKKINSIVTKEDPTKVQREVEKAQREIERARRKQALKLQMEEDRLGRRKSPHLPSSSSSERRYTGIDADEDEDDYDDEDGIYNRPSRVTSNGYEEDDFVVEDEEEGEGEDLAESDDDEKLEAAAARLRKVKEAGAAEYDGSKRSASEAADDDEAGDDDDDGAVVRKKRRVVLNEDDDDE